MQILRRFLIAAFAATTLAFGAASAKASDIVDTAILAGDFNTLVSAVKATGLVETLKGDGPFTVFAPTDEAFAKPTLIKTTTSTATKSSNSIGQLP